MKERFLQNRRLVFHYYFVIGIAFFIYWWLAGREGLVDSIILSILAIYLILFPLVILYVRKYAVHIFLFLLALITGFYGFYHYSIEEHSAFNALYFTFQLYVLETTDVFTQDGSALLQYPLIIEIARWSAALYTISTIFIAMYRMLENSILVFIYQLIGNHTIVFGYNEESMTLIENLRKQKKRVIFVAEHLPHEVIDYLEVLKIAVVQHHDRQDNLYMRCGVGRAKSIVMLHQDDKDNLNEFLNFRTDFIKHGRENEELIVYIHLRSQLSKKLFSELEDTLQETSVKIKLINMYETFANQLFEEHPIDQVGEQTNMLIIGFDLVGQYIARQATLDSGKQLQITVLTESSGSSEQEWQRNYPAIQAKIPMSFQAFDITKDALEKVILEQSKPVTHIYFCMDENVLDLSAVFELSSRFPHIPIYLEYTEGSFTEKWLQSEVNEDRRIHSLGTLQEILTEETLLK